MHACDNRLCIEPTHLSAGTQRQNMDDMMSKGRKAVLRGEKHGMARLTEVQVREIRRRYKRYDRTSSAAVLAREFGISQQSVADMLRGKSWKWLP